MSALIEVRRLGLEDFSLAGEMIRTFKAIGEPSERRSLDPADMGAWLSRSSNILIGATSDGRPAGFALGYLLDRVDEARPMLFFYEIEIAASCRKRGVGRHLVEAMKDVAYAKRASKMWVQTHPGNAAARALYRSTGGVESESLDLLYVWTNKALSNARDAS